MTLAPAGLLLALAAAPPIGGAPSEDLRGLGDRLVDAVEQVLGSKKKAARRSLEALRRDHPRPAQIDGVRGMAWLVWGKPARARRDLPKTARWAVYRAMAEMGTRGGLSRATAHLARAAREPGAPAGVRFLVALAFARSGQADKADRHLKAALRDADDALDATWAPDPAVGLAEAAQVALFGLLPEAEVKVRLAEALLGAGRRGAALAWTQELPEAERWRRRALALRARAMAQINADAAVDAVARWRRAEPEATEARLLAAEHALEHRRGKDAKRLLEAIEQAPARLRARLSRARARLALDQDRPQDALRHARSALRAELESARGRRLIAQALLQTGEVERAAEVAEDLLRRRPRDVDPYALLVQVRKAQGRLREVKALELRSKAFADDRAARARLEAHTEKVFSAVRDAEAGLGQTGLTALRGQDPRFALPIDIALARSAHRGLGRAARDRILNACGVRLERLLTPRGSWARVKVPTSRYGRSGQEWVEVSAADPFRCRGRRGLRDTKR